MLTNRPSPPCQLWAWLVRRTCCRVDCKEDTRDFVEYQPRSCLSKGGCRSYVLHSWETYESEAKVQQTKQNKTRKVSSWETRFYVADKHPSPDATISAHRRNFPKCIQHDLPNIVTCTGQVQQGERTQSPSALREGTPVRASIATAGTMSLRCSVFDY